jgi:hypothetical protein
MKKILHVLLLSAYVLTSYGQTTYRTTKVKITKNKNGFELLVNNRPYFIKGAVGSDYLEKLKLYGGNSIRTGSKVEILDKANLFGLNILSHKQEEIATVPLFRKNLCLNL